MLKLYSFNLNLKNSLKNDSRYQTLIQEEELLNTKFNCYSTKSYEYFFFQYFMQYSTFKLKEIMNFISFHFNSFSFKHDLKNHLISNFCESMGKDHFKLKHRNWTFYFKSDINNVSQFLDLHEDFKLAIFQFSVSDLDCPILL